MAMSRSFGGRSLTRRSPMRISPAVISSSPAIMRSSVDLPQPEGPTRTVKEPSAMSMSTPCSTGVPPKRLCTDEMVTLAMGARVSRSGGGRDAARVSARRGRRCLRGNHSSAPPRDSYDDPTTMRSPAPTPRPAGPVQPLVAERLSDRLAARLRAELKAGEWRPGERLPTEHQLAQAHGVSRTVVREAVHQLRSRGLLVSRQGSGVYVAEAPPAALELEPPAPGSVEAVVQIREERRALEAETAALAAARASALQVAALRRALRAID